VRDRLAAAGISAERIEQHRATGRIRVDGEFVTHLDTPRTAARTHRHHGPLKAVITPVGQSRSSST
jgi:hypothetical protein